MSEARVAITSQYADVLTKNRIRYMPSCIIVEMMMRIYRKVAAIPFDQAQERCSELVGLLEQLAYNLRTTADAFAGNRIAFFVGDWADDKVRTRKLFFNLMARLGLLGEMVDENARRELYECTEEMAARWNDLDAVMEIKCRESEHCESDCDSCYFFRSLHPGCWQQIMANILLSLQNEDRNRDQSGALILLCYSRIRSQLLHVIRDIEQQNGAKRAFPAERILVLSDEDPLLSCPKCALVVDSMRREGSTVIVRRPDAMPRRAVVSLPRPRPTPNRYLMPSSLAGIGQDRI